MPSLSLLWQRAREAVTDAGRFVMEDRPVIPPVVQGRNGALDLLVIDRSPSMTMGTDYPPNRLAGACEAARRFLGQRLESRPDALVGLIVFGYTARWLVRPVPLRSHHAQLVAALRKIDCQEYTNIGGALQAATREARRFAELSERRVLLLTDGESNCEPEPEGVATKAKEEGLQLDIVGIGGSPKEVNEPMLRRMASVVGGQQRYWFIRSLPALLEKFQELALREVK